MAARQYVLPDWVMKNNAYFLFLSSRFEKMMQEERKLEKQRQRERQKKGIRGAK